jgi:hypothetical protein
VRRKLIFHYCCILLFPWKHAHLWIRYSAMAVAQLLISRSLHSNGSTYHFIQPRSFKEQIQHREVSFVFLKLPLCLKRTYGKASFESLLLSILSWWLNHVSLQAIRLVYYHSLIYRSIFTYMGACLQFPTYIYTWSIYIGPISLSLYKTFPLLKFCWHFWTRINKN